MATAEDWLKANVFGPYEPVADYAKRAFNAGVESGTTAEALRQEQIRAVSNVVQNGTKENSKKAGSADGKRRGDSSKRFAERLARRQEKESRTKAGKRQKVRP